MKVLKLTDSIIKQLDEIDFILKKVERKKLKPKESLMQDIKSIRKSVLEIKKLHSESSPVELFFLSDLLLKLNDVLRYLIVNKLEFRDYAIAVEKLSTLVERSAYKAYYDFFRLCGACASCCISPHVFSFEHDFIEKYRKKLAKKGLSYVVKNNPKTGLCGFYDKKTKRCTIYLGRPIDCTFFPFTFVIQKISAPKINAAPRNYVFLCKATDCGVAKRLSLNDALEAMEMICFVLSKISLKEAIEYSGEIDPRRIIFDLSIPYDERKTYYNTLKQIFSRELYLKKV